MKAIIQAYSPEEIERIARGEQTIKVCKTAPKDTPFKVYMYCIFGGFIDKQRTIPKEPLFRETHFDGIKYTTSVDLSDKTLQEYKLANGKVVGDYVCENAEKFTVGSLRSDDIEKLGCLSYSELINYFYKPCELDGKTVKQGKALHISAVKIYDKPKELSEFKTPPCEKGENACANCKWLVKVDTPDRYECECYVEDGKPITHPPRGWQYVEELSNFYKKVRKIT